MEILIINGSPKKNGTIGVALHNEISKLQPNDRVKTVNVHELNFADCKACMTCRTQHQCCLPDDDAHTFGKMLQKADHIIIGAPVYWANMPGKLKMLFDRVVYEIIDTSKYGLPKKKLKGKKATLITSCAVPAFVDVFSGQTRGCRRSIAKILQMGGVRIVKSHAFRNSRAK
jgi:multimeric flavodoxin WrbA